MMNAQRVRLWDEINRYVVACGGDPSQYVYGNTPRQVAVAQVEKIVRDVEAAWSNDMRKVADECESLRAKIAECERERDEWHSQCCAISEAQASALSGESEAVRRAEAAELGCEIAYRREPTQAEGDAHADGEDECFVPMGGWTGRRCRRCRRWAWGGPTACEACAAFEAGQERAESDVASLTRENAALRARIAKAEEVVSCARLLGTYDWEGRLDDSKTSDDAKIDARELGIAVWHYDEMVKAHAAESLPYGHISRADECQVEVCGKKCDHGSECLALPGHDGGHETQHGCIFYAAESPAPDSDAASRFRARAEAAGDEVLVLASDDGDVCPECDGTRYVEMPDEYEDGGMSRSLSLHPCTACNGTGRTGAKGAPNV